MAWQLIYTSAPRSLEAGRSGFGTVARHRALSPLLVSAIERTSQFSRLPGVDTDRVIFSHRVVTVAGSRFHVLSSIRDAGADYTGRTNHIAHHLIVDPREIAQLGASGPSPADVLLAMPWATSWTEHPRYLEAADEVALATLHARTTGTAWQRITGDPNQAGLLATGDASRGAYIIQPPGFDLREVFAESLRLMPERLWQISFTTSLQPSDESADFRWIGIEERSPLRTQAESSGRPVLNLASPGTLPLVEVAQPAAASPVQQSFAPTPAPISSPSSDEGRTAWPTATSVTTQRPTQAPIERGVEWPSASTPPSTRANRKWWLLAGAMSIIVAAASVAFFVGRPIYTKYKHRKEVSAEIDSVLNRSGYFSNAVHVELKSAEPVDLGKKLAEAADRSWQVAREAKFDAMLLLPDTALIERARSAKINIPTEINALDNRLKNIASIHQWLQDFKPQQNGDKALEDLTKKRNEAEQETSPTPKTNTFDKIKGVIDQLANKQRAEEVLWLLKNVPIRRPHPDQTIDWFDKALSSIVPSTEDQETTLILQAAHKLIEDWKYVEAQEPSKVLTDLEKRFAEPNNKPSWLKAKAHPWIAVMRTGKAPPPNESIPSTVPNAPKISSPASDQPDAHSRLPLYFVNGKDSLQKVRIEELRPELKFFLQPGIDKQGIELSDATKTGKLRQQVTDDQVSFTVEIAKKAILLETGAGKLDLPFSLLAKDAMGTEVFRIWLVATASTPLFPQSTLGLSRKGNVLEFNPLALRINGAPKNQLRINLPDTCFAVSKESSELQPLVNWKFDLSAQRKIIEAGIVTLKQQLERLKEEVPEAPKNNQNQYVALADQFEKAVNFTEEQKKRDFPDAAASPRQKYGGYLQAISRNLKKSGDPVFNVGNKLKTLKSEITGKEVEDAFNKAEKALKEARTSLLDNPKEKAAHESHLNQLLDMLKLLRSETPQEKQGRETKEQNRVRNVQGLEAKIKAVNPLISEQVPPGTYRIFANHSGVNIPIVEIVVPQPNQP